MCDRFNENLDCKQIPNTVFSNFKKKLIESNYQIKCKKCQQNSGFALLQKKDVLCGYCLVQYCTHKFRSTIGKSRFVKMKDRILIGFSGGLNSIALVDMIQRGLEEPNFHRKLRFIPALFYIDESILNDEKEASEIGLTKKLFQFMLQTGLTCFFTTLQNNIEPKSFHQTYIKITPDQSNSYENLKEFIIQSNKSECGQKFCEYYYRLQTLTSKYDFLVRFKYLIIIKMAKEMNFDKVFIANTMSELAVGLMNNISFGRGNAVESEMGFCDDRYGPSVLLLRPMCELSNKEIAFYLKFRKLDHLSFKSDITSTKFPIKSSIQRLTEHFLVKLSEEYPSTLYTVYNIGTKIITKNFNIEYKQCKFCLTKLDLKSEKEDEGLNYSSYDALRFTSTLSIGCESDKSNRNQNEIIYPFSDYHYCFSCQRICNEMNNNNENVNDVDIFRKFCILYEF